MTSGLGPENKGSITDASKDPSSHAVYVLIKTIVPKVPWSVVGSLPWVLSLEKISLPCQRHIKIVEMDGAAINRQEAEI